MTAIQDAAKKYGSSESIATLLVQYQIEADYGVNYRKFASFITDF